MTPADMRARADWLEKWCEEKTTPAMLRAGADAIEEVERLRGIAARLPDDIEIYRLIKRAKVRKHWLIALAIAARISEFESALTPQEPHHD
jgi:hypothetical protein